MDTVKQWAFSACATMIACGLAQMVLPRSNLEKIFRLTVSVFFLCCLLSPLVLTRPELRLEWEDYSSRQVQERAQQLEQELLSQTKTALDRDLKKIIEEKLDEMGIKCHTVTINMITNGQNEQQLDGVELVLDAAHERERESVRDEIQQLLGLPVKISCAFGEGGV